jgi:NTP pyrophosphatase (non-canonical NTP hydrolase)
MKGRSMSLSNYTYITDTLSSAALYEQLAEECVELAHACQKKARLLRGENPTPLTDSDINAMVEEEFTDVSLVSSMLGLDVDEYMYYEKIDRWAERLS